jgi:hypothetical protein
VSKTSPTITGRFKKASDKSSDKEKAFEIQSLISFSSSVQRSFKPESLAEPPEDKMWIFYACFSMVCMCLFNYINSSYNKGLVQGFSGKIVNSVVLGVASLMF